MNQPPGGNGFPPGPKPSFGQTQLMPGSAYGPPGQPGFGQPQPGQPGQPGAPAFGGQPQFGQPAPQQPGFGGQPGFDPNAGQGYGQPQGQPGGYGAPGMPQQQGYGGQPGFDPNAGQQGYGQPAAPGFGAQAGMAGMPGAAPQPGYGAPGGYDPNAGQYGQPQGQPGYGGQPGMPGGQPGMPGGQPGYPGQAPGMPGGQPGYGAPPAGGQGNMQVGFGGVSFQAPTIGGVNLGGGDFSKDALLSAVVQGNGFESPRKVGGAMFGLGFLFFIINTVLIVAHFYYPYLYSLGAIFWWGGLWLLITGQPRKNPDGSKAPMWARAGLGVCLFIGLIVGILAIVVPWEPTG